MMHPRDNAGWGVNWKKTPLAPPVAGVRLPRHSAMPLLGLGPGGVLLVVVAHPDDELAISATLREVVRRGHPVFLHIATSGERSQSGATGPEREAESTNACAALGIARSHLSFQRLPDGGVLEHLPQLVEKTRGLIVRHHPQTVLSIALEGGHLDHDSVNAAVFLARRGTPTVMFEFPTYHVEGMMPRALRFARHGPPGGVTQYVKPADHKALYEQQKNLYPSQIKGLNQMEKTADVSGLIRRGEAVRLVPRDRDYTVAPGTRPLGYEIMAFPRRRWFGEFRHALKALQDKGE